MLQVYDVTDAMIQSFHKIIVRTEYTDVIMR